MISTNLRTLRKAHKYSQENVADKIKVTRQAVAKWESGETLPDIVNCMALAKLYDVTIDQLVNHTDEYNGALIPPKGKHMFGTVTVGARGQIVIPKKAREIFDIHSGDDLMVMGDEAQGIALIKNDKFMEFAEEILKMMNYNEGTTSESKIEETE